MSQKYKEAIALKNQKNFGRSTRLRDERLRNEKLFMPASNEGESRFGSKRKLNAVGSSVVDDSLMEDTKDEVI